MMNQMTITPRMRTKVTIETDSDRYGSCKKPLPVQRRRTVPKPLLPRNTTAERKSRMSAFNLRVETFE